MEMLCMVKTGCEKQPGKEKGDVGRRIKKSERVLNYVTHGEEKEEVEEEEKEEEKEEEEKEEDEGKKRKKTLILMMLVIHFFMINVLYKNRLITETVHETQDKIHAVINHKHTEIDKNKSHQSRDSVKTIVTFRVGKL